MLRNKYEVHFLVQELFKRPIEVVAPTYFDWHELDLQVRSGSLNAPPVDCGSWIEAVQQHSNFGSARDYFQCQRKLLSRQSVQRYQNPGHLAARASFAGSQTETDGIDHSGGDDWD